MLIVSRKRRNALSPPILKPETSAIDRTHSYKYLGVLITSRLSWSEHIHAISTREKRYLIFMSTMKTISVVLLI